MNLYLTDVLSLLPRYIYSYFYLYPMRYLYLLEVPDLGGGLIGYVKSKPLGNGQIISIDILVLVMIIAVFHKKLI